MKVVDLRGRQDETDVKRLLEHSHARPERLEEARTQYGSGAWTFLGWEEAGEIVACAGAEAHGPRSIGIHSIAVEPAWRNRGLGRALLDALAERAEATRIVAETDDDAVGFYRRCGFAVEHALPKFGRARYWCVLDR